MFLKKNRPNSRFRNNLLRFQAKRLVNKWYSCAACTSEIPSTEVPIKQVVWLARFSQLLSGFANGIVPMFVAADVLGNLNHIANCLHLLFFFGFIMWFLLLGFMRHLISNIPSSGVTAVLSNKSNQSSSSAEYVKLVFLLSSFTNNLPIALLVFPMTKMLWIHRLY